MDILIIALIIAVIFTILGGVLLSIAKFFEFLEPIAYTLLILGGVGTFILAIGFMTRYV